MIEGLISVVSPGAYVVSDGFGDFRGISEDGLFFRDMRHLSKFVLTVDGAGFESGGCELRGSAARFVSGAGSVEVERRREVGFGMREEISFTNRGSRAAEFRANLELAADFLDVFEVRGYAEAKERGKVSAEVRGNGLRFSYERGDFRRATTVEVSDAGTEAEANSGGASAGTGHEAEAEAISDDLSEISDDMSKRPGGSPGVPCDVSVRPGNGADVEAGSGDMSAISSDIPPSSDMASPRPGDVSAISGVVTPSPENETSRPGGVSEISGAAPPRPDDMPPSSGVVSADMRVEARQTRTLRISVDFEEYGEKVHWREPKSLGSPESPKSLYGNVPEIVCENSSLVRTWRRSVEDLETLAFDAGGGFLVPAAGSPWYMALFGRDSLIASHMTVMLGAESAKNTLRALAHRQAAGFDDFTDAEPGKILHEARNGELAFFGEVPHSPYFGTADATPLFLVLLEEAWRWTGDAEFIREMESAARGALAWVSASTASGDGFIAYETRSTAGLENHSWKDSENSMLFQDGSLANAPIAPCEIQGYAYDAFLRAANLAEKAWRDDALASELREEAASLKTRFDRTFWMDDRKYYALALDGGGQKVDSLASNAGHLLWSGIVPEEKAGFVAERLLGDGFFSGWGIRTMAEGEGGHDPESYHNGSVWPHDNAIIAEGLRRYGFREEANRVASAIFEAAPHFGHRLPEVFAGHVREEGRPPAEFPRSCSPQAWAAASAVSLVRTMLGVEPDERRRGLRAENSLSGVRLSGVPAFGEFHEIGGGFGS